MRILNQYTRRSLRLNRVRTLVTIIGIILSVALITAVAEGAYSGQQYMLRVEEQRVGAFAAYYDDMTAGQVDTLRNDPAVAAVTTFEQVGWADIGSKNEYKPYLFIAAVPQDVSELVGIHLLEGRMPQNDSELLIPEHLYTNGAVSLSLGQTLTLQVGTRYAGGSTLSRNEELNDGETLEDTAEKTYTVVGFINRPDSVIENFSAAGYTALTAGTGSGSYTAFFKLHNMGKVFDYVDNSGLTNPCAVNTDLLYYYGSTANSRVARTIYGLAAILIVLIMFGSVCLIYNSFSISVSERTRQFGLLKSIGATKRQLRHTVLYEALVLCVIAIPIGLIVGCVGIGVTLQALQGSFAALAVGESTVSMQLAVSPVLLVIAAAIGLVTALISAWIPAKRTMKLSPIDAIRQSKDIAVKGSQVRTSKLTGKLFGFEGLLASKNFKRNRKKYRSTVISLFMSLVLFISASSFSSYLRSSVQSYLEGSTYDITYHYYQEDTQLSEEQVLNLLTSAKGVTDGTYTRSWEIGSARCEKAGLSEQLRNDSSIAEPYELSPLTVAFMPEESFRKLLSENGLPQEDYFNEEAPLALAYDHFRREINLDDGTVYADGRVFGENTPIALQGVSVKQLDGYESNGYYTNEHGERIYEYVSYEYYESDETDRDAFTKEVPASEAETLQPFTVGAVLEEPPICVDDGVITLLYPLSMEKVLGESESGTSTRFFFTSESHAETAKDMTSILKDAGLDYTSLYDTAVNAESTRAVVTVLDVFSYGFIILISLIAAANVFNTISTNISLRRREFAMLKSVGMTRGGFNRMMNFECLLYGFKALVLGLPVSLVLTYLIYRAVGSGFVTSFYVPWMSVLIAVCSVFAVLFATMLYSMSKIKRDNPIDALRNENL